MCFGGGDKTVYKDAKPLGSDTKADGGTTKRREDLLRAQETKSGLGSTASPLLYDAGGTSAAILGAG